MSKIAKLAAAAVVVVCACRAKPPPGPTDAAPAPVALRAPSAADADVVTGASGTYDAGPAVLATGSVDGAALRERHRARLAWDHSAVTLVQGGTALALGRRLCEASVPVRAADVPILLKPNIGGFEWFKSGADDGLKGRLTDPEFVRGVIRCLKARGHTRITVADGWGATHADWVRLAKASGYEAMTRDEGVQLVAMDDDGVFDVEGDTPGKPLRVTGMEHTRAPTLLIPKILAEHLDHGMFISLPKIKAHRFGVFSMAIKGTQGTVMLSDASPAFHQKWRMHRELGAWIEAKKKGAADDRAGYVRSLEAFAERIVDVFEVNTPDVVLAEGAPAMGGDGFAKQVPSAESFAVGGTNAVLVDRVGAALLGLWDNRDLARELGGHATSPLLEVAGRRFAIDLTSPLIEGDGKALLDRPRRADLDAMAGFSIHSAPGASTDPSPVAHAAALAGDAIAVDGKGDDAAWARAAAVTWDTDFAGRDTAIVTHARFVWDKDALYMRIDNEGAGLHVDARRPIGVERAKLYEEDCDELFIAPDPKQPRRYFEIELGPMGHFLDVALDRTGPRARSDVAWSSDLRVATSSDPGAGTSTIEARIAAREITAALKVGAALPMGLFRMEGKMPRSYLAWSPPRTTKPDFHRPEAFGILMLDEPAASTGAER